jgi:hypothetical protein
VSTARPLALRALIAVGFVALLAVHIVMLHHLASRAAIPVVAAMGLGALVIAKHVGLFAAVHRRLRRPRA